jgi:hypothetical protein
MPWTLWNFRPYRSESAIAPGEGGELTVVERGVAVADEVFVAAPVVPAKGQRVEAAACLHQIKDGFVVGGEILLVAVFIDVFGTAEERGGWELLLVSDGDEGSCAVDAVDGVSGAYLTGFIEDDDVEFDVRRQVLADGEGTHHEAGVDGLDDISCAADQVTNWDVLSLLLSLAKDDSCLPGGAAGSALCR